MQNAVAFTNNDVVIIAWGFEKKPDGCIGFTIYRIDNKNKETPLPSHAVFPGQKIKPGQTTKDFPVQKLYWKDVYARLEAEKTGNRKFRYKIVPLMGGKGNLKEMPDHPFIITNEVEISAAIDKNISVYFNRGLISTQRISNAFKGNPTKGPLLARIIKPDDELRKSLTGDMADALCTFLDRAKLSGKIYAGLYELGDEQLIKKLKGLKGKLNIVLSNSAKTEDDTSKKPVKGKDGKMKLPKKTSDGNQDARDQLKKTTKNIWDRIMPSGHIGHNKFLVYEDKNKKPQAVLLGSTNWTPTGLCTQTNNTLVIDDAKLAKRYLAYWNELKKDTLKAKGVSKILQGAVLRTFDATGETLKLANVTALQSWFSPNTPKPRSSKHVNEKRPPDMDAVVKCINKAQHAILFLAFYPGSPSIANWTADAAKKNKNLFVRGCVTNKSASEGFYYELKGQTPPAKVKGQHNPVKQDPRVLGAEAFDGKTIPPQWKKEILAAGFAIIHDKVMVIDPFSDNCVVITGSHNLGHKASFDNDENLVIVQGNKKLAMAYATHVLDVYDHFSARVFFKQDKDPNKNFDLKENPEKWLGRYYDEKGNLKGAQSKFWLQADSK